MRVALEERLIFHVSSSSRSATARCARSSSRQFTWEMMHRLSDGKSSQSVWSATRKQSGRLIGSVPIGRCHPKCLSTSKPQIRFLLMVMDERRSRISDTIGSGQKCPISDRARTSVTLSRKQSQSSHMTPSNRNCFHASMRRMQTTALATKNGITSSFVSSSTISTHKPKCGGIPKRNRRSSS